jgi:hypothetical protein
MDCFRFWPGQAFRGPERLPSMRPGEKVAFTLD